MNKPAISNDIVNDPRIKYHQWTKEENLKSFAGYPLTYDGELMGILAIFSEKRLKLIEFELIGIFCKNISNELSNFLMVKNFY
jgi:GAF domain-containing protein